MFLCTRPGLLQGLCKYKKRTLAQTAESALSAPVYAAYVSTESTVCLGESPDRSHPYVQSLPTSTEIPTLDETESCRIVSHSDGSGITSDVKTLMVVCGTWHGAAVEEVKATEDGPCPSRRSQIISVYKIFFPANTKKSLKSDVFGTFS